jgi:hypothetical protein
VQRDDLEDIVVLTNALPIALELEPAIPRFSVIVTGGTLRPLQHSLMNPLATTLLEQLHVDTAFIGCTGVTRAASPRDAARRSRRQHGGEGLQHAVRPLDEHGVAGAIELDDPHGGVPRGDVAQISA